MKVFQEWRSDLRRCPGLLCRLAVLVPMALYLPAIALGQTTPCADWDRSSNTIFYQGEVIGIADVVDFRAEDAAGNPLSQTLGLTCVTDGEHFYRPDDLRTPLENEPEDNPPFDLCSIPFNPLCPNGGNGTSGDNGTNDPDTGTSPADATQTASIKRDPYAENAVVGSGGKITFSVALSTAKDIVDGAETGSKGTNSSSPNSKSAPRAIRPLLLSGTLSQLEEGAHSSPSLIDPREIKHAYPELMHKETKDGRPSLGSGFEYQSNTKLPDPKQLGVDDEFLKSALAIYQPLVRMHKDFLQDRNAREEYLDGGATLRGVTIMAMGFLDKTLGAGLVAVQQQADQNVMQNLLKQVSWTTARLANEGRDAAYRDTDEKLEACLEWAEHKKAATKEIEIGKTTREFVYYNCAPECGEPPDLSAKRAFRIKESTRPKSGNGTFNYCVCCAETTATLNALSDDGEREPKELVGEDTRQLFTLAERAFLGTQRQGNIDSAVNFALEKYKRIYGDFVLTPKPGVIEATSSSGAKADSDKHFHYYYQVPKWSPQMLTALFKNRCYHTNGPPKSDLGKTSNVGCNGDEDISDFGIYYGVCPALMKILENWEGILSGKVALESKWWIEASLGHPINGAQIKFILSRNGDPASKISNGEEDLLVARFIESFCEASSVAALARLHSHFKAHFIDHLTLSQVITVPEKNRLMTLVDRYSQYLALAEVDTSSKYLTEAALTGVSISYDRWKTAHMGAASQGAVALANRSSNVSGIWGLLSSGHIVSTGSGAGSGQRGRSRDSGEPGGIVQSYADAFGPAGGVAIGNVERRRSQDDPINAIVRHLPK